MTAEGAANEIVRVEHTHARKERIPTHLSYRRHIDATALSRPLRGTQTCRFIVMIEDAGAAIEAVTGDAGCGCS